MLNVVKSVAVKVGMKVGKHSPEILLGFGVVGVIAGTVMACKATLKAEEILEQHNKDLAAIKKAQEVAEQNGCEFKPEEIKRDRRVVYFRTIGNMAKVYAPAVTVEAIALAAIGCSYGIMRKRNLGLIAAYKGLQEAFKNYRGRVKDRYGDEIDKELRHGITTGKITQTDEEGKETTEIVEGVVDEHGYSQYSRYFDSSSPNWVKDPSLNLTFLKTQENYMNDRLQIIGHVFLNEVYDALGLPRSKAGAVVGWVKGKGDNYIDFGIFNAKREKNRDFVNGYENVIILDFNVDGVIWDLI